jgi:hypothetical protein
MPAAEAIAPRIAWRRAAAVLAYVAALDPNVTIVNREVVIRKRDVPLTDDRVRAIEAEWWRRVGAPLPR